jgi:hypothetical protein
MGATGIQRIAIFMLPLLLALILMVYSLAVEIDFYACFMDYADLNNSQGPHGFWSMSFDSLLQATLERFSSDQIVVLALGFLPLSPFVVAWLVTKDGHLRSFWLASALVAFLIVIVSLMATGLDAYHDCDRKGVSIAILLMPIIYALVSTAAVCGISILRVLTR